MVNSVGTQCHIYRMAPLIGMKDSSAIIYERQTQNHRII